MIIPIKCFSCGNVIADLYIAYINMVRSKKLARGETTDRIAYFTSANMEKSIEGHVLDELGIVNVCCRRHMITHVDDPYIT